MGKLKGIQPQHVTTGFYQNPKSVMLVWSYKSVKKNKSEKKKKI